MQRGRGLVQVVADPNVLISAVVTPGGTCARLLAELVSSPVRLVVSPLVLDEVERVLARPKFRAISAAQRTTYIAYLTTIGLAAADPPDDGNTLVARDPGDDYLVRLVQDDPSRILVTCDPHLLELAGTHPVVSPRDLLDRLPR
jgi:uncharacterized protein